MIVFLTRRTYDRILDRIERLEADVAGLRNRTSIAVRTSPRTGYGRYDPFYAPINDVVRQLLSKVGVELKYIPPVPEAPAGVVLTERENPLGE